MSSDWNIVSSESSKDTCNPIREALKNIVLKPDHPDKINLGIGDPSLFVDFHPPQVMVDIMRDELMSFSGNGYINSIGTNEARQAVADFYSTPEHKIAMDDVWIDIGCSGAIATTMNVLLNEGDNFLYPSPGFPLYATIAGNRGYVPKTYNCLPDRNWEVDIEQMETLVDERTKLLVIVNPSNPTAAVFTREHLLQLVDFAKRHKIPILADEIYAHMVYDGEFVSLGPLTDEVPIICMGGLAKRWLVPGWRVGWGIIYDPRSLLGDFRDNLFKSRNVMLHAHSYAVNALPRIFSDVPAEFFTETNEKLRQRAELVYEKVCATPGLKMNKPQGALYAMIMIDFDYLDPSIDTSLKFCEGVALEHGLLMLPAECFSYTGGFRVVICNPVEVLDKALTRVGEYIEAHKRK